MRRVPSLAALLVLGACSEKTEQTYTVDELIAHGRSIEQIEALLGCDWLVYQDIEDLEAAVREGNPELQRFDSSCFDGQYVTGIEPGYFERIQQLRSDEAKKKRRVAS